MRSELRARTKSIAVCFATSMRLDGAKSSDSMLLDTSTHSTIEIPSVRTSVRAAPRRRPVSRREGNPLELRQHVGDLTQRDVGEFMLEDRQALCHTQSRGCPGVCA